MRSAIMSSIAMAADSTQAEIVHHRAKASVHRTGMRGTHLLQEDYSRSRHSYLSRHIKQTKSRRKLQNRSKTGARQNQSIIHDDCSDHDSDLDLSKDLLPISGYARIEDEMVDHMFRSISNRKLRAMLPEILKPLGTNDLKKLCVEQLEVMSKKRICCILDGADPDTISSSGTEEDDFYEDENSRHSTDIETEGRDVVSASAESEAVGSTSFYEADAVKLRSNQERCMTDGSNETSAEKKELLLEEAERARVSDQEENSKEENVETHKSMVFHSISKEDKNYEHENEHPMFKLCESKYVEECVSDEISRDETIKQGRSVAERCYRTKQLDDDDHENLDGGRRPPEEIRDTCDQNNEGAEIINKGFLDACQPKDDHVLDNDCISDVGSIPSSLPSLESEPEETCLPLQILDNNFVNAGGPATTLESTHTLVQLSVQMAPGIAGLNSEFSTRSCQDKPISCTSDELDVLKTSNVCEVVSANSQMKIDDFNATMSKRSPVASVGSKSAELTAENEEMIIEVQDHEFSDEFEDAFGCGVKASDSKELSQKMYKQSFGTGMKALYHEEAVQEMGFDKQSLDLSKSHSLQKQQLLEEVAKSEKMDTEEIHSIDKGDKVSESKELKRKLFEKSDINYILPKSSEVFCQNVFVGKGQTRLILEQKKSCIIIDKSESSGNIPLFNSDIVLKKPCLTDLSDAADICFEKCGSLRENQTPQTNSTESGCIAGFKYSCNSEESKTEQLSIVKVLLLDGSAEEAQLSFEADNEEPMCQKSDSENLQIEVRHKRETAIQGQSKTVSPCLKTTTEDNGIVMDSVPVLSKTQLEILELEMRARAIKAMLKAQEELERREEKLKFEDKYHLVPQVTSQTARSSQSSEHHRVLSEEKKELRPVTSQRLSTFAVESGNAQGEKTRIIQNSMHTQKYKTAQLVKRQPQTPAAGMSDDMAQTMLSRQSCSRLPAKSSREVMNSSKLVTSNLIKRPVTVATRGKAASGSSLTSFGSGSRRIVRLSSEQRTADSRTVVHRPNAISSRAVTSEKISKPVTNRTDTRRVITTSCNSQVSRMTYDTIRYGYRDREHRSPAREQSRSVVTWQRQTVVPKEGFRGNRV